MLLSSGHTNMLTCDVSILGSYECHVMFLTLGQMNLLVCHVPVLGSYESSYMSCF